MRKFLIGWLVVSALATGATLYWRTSSPEERVSSRETVEERSAPPATYGPDASPPRAQYEPSSRQDLSFAIAVASLMVGVLGLVLQIWVTTRPQLTPPSPEPTPPPLPPLPERGPTVVHRGNLGLSLEALDGPLNGQRIPIDKERFQVGAGPDCDLRITSDDYLSSTHAVIHAFGGQWLLFDQQSRNGTFVDGTQLTSERGRALQHGERIRMGGSEFRVVLGDAHPSGERRER